MRNPWEEIRLEDYEKHMALDSVRQLQALNGIMKAQMEAYPVKTVMILGVAGGNGLEHATRKSLTGCTEWISTGSTCRRREKGMPGWGISYG